MLFAEEPIVTFCEIMLTEMWVDKVGLVFYSHEIHLNLSSKTFLSNSGNILHEKCLCENSIDVQFYFASPIQTHIVNLIIGLVIVN